MVRIAPGWRLEEVEVLRGGHLDGAAVVQIRVAHPGIRILAVTQPGGAAVAFPSARRR